VLRLFDSASGEVRELELREPGRVSIYVCGPTVSGLPHLGHGRFSLVWDVVRRWLTWQGLEVTYASNITDIDDKIIDRARQEGRDHTDVAVQFEAEWWSAMAGLGIARPDRVPYATQYVGEMVDLISTLLERDIAYITSDGVYFDVSRVEDYGLLAGQPLESLRSGARIEANEEKRSPLDFAVWKFAKIGEPMWEAPFGQGRPGWHTECVVMSLGLLGEGFELHTGGQDLKFPHHENERAQAVALGARFARHWGHNGWVVVGGEKMGKSLNNYTSLTDLLSTTDQRAYRLLVLRSHYRSPIEVSKETIADAERALARLDAFARRFELAELAGAQHMARADERSFTDESLDLRAHVAALLDDDLDTPRAVSVLFEAVTRAHARADHGDDAAARELAEGRELALRRNGSVVAGRHRRRR
jgi:cysteinyl-tRNA synthetase